MSYATSGDGLPPAAVSDPLVRFQIALVQLTRIAIIVLASVFTVIIIASVARRYLLGDPIIWVEEIARFLLAWIVFLGVSVAAYERGHIAMDALQRALPFQPRKLLDVTLNLLMILFLAVVVYEGLELSISVTGQISPALEISYFWPYLSMPVGAALTIVHLLFILRDDVRQLAHPQRTA